MPYTETGSYHKVDGTNHTPLATVLWREGEANYTRARIGRDKDGKRIHGPENVKPTKDERVGNEDYWLPLKSRTDKSGWTEGDEQKHVGVNVLVEDDAVWEETIIVSPTKEEKDAASEARVNEILTDPVWSMVFEVLIERFNEVRPASALDPITPEEGIQDLKTKAKARNV